MAAAADTAGPVLCPRPGRNSDRHPAYLTIRCCSTALTKPEMLGREDKLLPQQPDHNSTPGWGRSEPHLSPPIPAGASIRARSPSLIGTIEATDRHKHRNDRRRRRRPTRYRTKQRMWREMIGEEGWAALHLLRLRRRRRSRVS